jgi:hypothetical protein
MSDHVFAAMTFEEVVAHAKAAMLAEAWGHEVCPACGSVPARIEWAPWPDNRALGLACTCACGRDWWARARWAGEIVLINGGMVVTDAAGSREGAC